MADSGSIAAFIILSFCFAGVLIMMRDRIAPQFKRFLVIFALVMVCFSFFLVMYSFLQLG